MKNFDYKKSLGQNFLMDKNIIHKISDSINPNEEDLIVEIGPGAGALTKELVKKNCELACTSPFSAIYWLISSGVAEAKNLIK